MTREERSIIQPSRVGNINSMYYIGTISSFSKEKLYAVTMENM